MTGRKRRRTFFVGATFCRPSRHRRSFCFEDTDAATRQWKLGGRYFSSRPRGGWWEKTPVTFLWYVASCSYIHIYTLYLLEVMLFSVLKIQLQVIGYRYVMCFYDLRAAEGKPLQGWRETDEVLEMSINLRLVPFAPWFLQTFCLYHNLI